VPDLLKAGSLTAKSAKGKKQQKATKGTKRLKTDAKGLRSRNRLPDFVIFFSSVNK
jgi:hypothetical protein